jgi:hypothetical protein
MTKTLPSTARFVRRKDVNRIKLACSALIAIAIVSSAGAVAQDSAERSWMDATGRYKIVGRLIDVKDNVAFIETSDGKTVKIPLTKLSKEDRDFLESKDSPFEVLEESDSKKNRSTAPAASTPKRKNDKKTKPSTTENGIDVNWSGPLDIDWNSVKSVESAPSVEWKLELPEKLKSSLDAKSIPMAKKQQFFEGIGGFAINPNRKRAVIGYTVSFNVPDPMTRVTLMDLAAGKAIQSEPIVANMRPLALLDDGASIVMTGWERPPNGHDDLPINDTLQVWKLSGTKIRQSALWTPFPMEKDASGKKANAAVQMLDPIKDDLALMLSDKGHLVLWDMVERVPQWQWRLGNGFSVATSADRQLVAVLDDKLLMIAKTDSGEILAGVPMEDGFHAAWPKLAWGPDGKQIALTSGKNVRVLDLTNGEWRYNITFPGHGLGLGLGTLNFPHKDYLLIGGLLVHIPTRVQVCEYKVAGPIQTIGETSFVALTSDAGGLFAACKLPHPTAEKILELARKDPSVFLIKPGVPVSIDVSGTGAYQDQVRSMLEAAVERCGYKNSPNAEIRVVATIGPPSQKEVHFIARGSYSMTAYDSSLKLIWGKNELWSTSRSNVPAWVRTKGDETIDQKLREMEKEPNLFVFEKAQFPEFMQRPNLNADSKASRSSAIMTSTLTLKGFVDEK